MGEIVQKKHDKAIQREKKQGTGLLPRQPTIPVLAPTRRPTIGRVEASDPMGSSANLIPRSNTLASNTPPPSYMSREPKLPHVEDFGPAPPARALTRGPGNAPVGAGHPAPSRSGTMRTHTSYASSASSRDYQQSVYSDHRMQQPYYDPTIDTEYVPQLMTGQRRMEGQHGGYAGDGEYHQLQPLQPGNSGSTAFVVDRLARNDTVGGGGWDSGQPPLPADQGQGGRGRFPIRPRDPVDQQLGGWGAPPPGPRSQTAGPQQMYRPPQPGPRSQTAGPLEGRYGPPPQNVGHQVRGYDAPPPQSRTAGPSEGAYGPPPRGNTAMGRMDGGYGGGAPRSHTTAPAAGAYGPPTRSHTAGPAVGAYGPPPRSRTAALGDDSYALPRINTAVGLDDGFHTPPPRITDGGYTTPQSAVSNPEYPPSRPMTAVAIEGGYGTPPRGQREYSRDSGQSPRDREEQFTQPTYAGKQTFRPPAREQPRGPSAQVRDDGLAEFGPPRRSRTVAADGVLEVNNTIPPPRSGTAPPPTTTMRGGFDKNGRVF